jgi:hypothetical protein
MIIFLKSHRPTYDKYSAIDDIKEKPLMTTGNITRNMPKAPQLYAPSSSRQENTINTRYITEDNIDDLLEEIELDCQRFFDQILQDLEKNQQKPSFKLNQKYESALIKNRSMLAKLVRDLEDRDPDSFADYINVFKHLLYQNNFYHALLSGNRIADEQGQLRDMDWYAKQLKDLEKKIIAIIPIL